MPKSGLGKLEILFGDSLLGLGKKIIATAMIVGHKTTNGRHGSLAISRPSILGALPKMDFDRRQISENQPLTIPTCNSSNQLMKRCTSAP